MFKRFHLTAKFRDIPVSTHGQEWKPVSSIKDLEARLETRNQYCDFDARLTPDAALAYLRKYAYNTDLPFFPRPQHVVCLGGLGLINHVGMKMFVSDAGLKLLEEKEPCATKASTSSASSSSPFAVFLDHSTILGSSVGQKTHQKDNTHASSESTPRSMG